MNILIAGDYYPAEGLKHIIERGEFSSVFGKNLLEVIRGSNFPIVNFESPIIAMSGEKPIEKCGPNLSSSRKAMEAIKWAGFKIVTLANNHINDFGPIGIYNTISLCEELGMHYVGIGNNIEDSTEIAYIKDCNETLAIINCCEHEFSIASQNTPGACPLDPIIQYHQITKAKKNADFVIVIVHGGHEQLLLPTPRMVNTYRFFVEIGADAVVNHHQHCFSGYEIYRERPIFYGLGNFCFDRHSSIGTDWNDGFMLSLDFSHERINFNLYPYIQCNGDNKVELIKDRSIFDVKINKLNEIISHPDDLELEINSFAATQKRSYYSAFEPYMDRFSRALYFHGLLPSFVKRRRPQLLDYFDCESHREMILRLLRQTDYVKK